MSKFPISVLLWFIFFSASAQHPYCSKYKRVTNNNGLTISDRRGDSIDIVNTRLTLDMTDIENEYISAAAELTLVAKRNSIRSIKLDLEGLAVDSVEGDDVVGYVQSETKIEVNFNALNANEQTSVTIYYSGTPMQDSSGWGGFYFKEDFSWNLGVGFADDPHSYGRVWHPCYDNFIEKSTYEFAVTTKNDRMAVCNGISTGALENGDGTNTYQWRLDEPISSYLACVAVAPYVAVEGMFSTQNGPLPYQIFGRASDSGNIVSSFQHLEDAVQKFEEAYGAYRFDKVGYSLVPFNAGAMEHAANITYPIYAVDGSLSQEELMAHELAHMWWGNNVTCQSDGDMWINEGWASFSEYLFLEAVYSRERYVLAMKTDLLEMLQFAHHREEIYRAVSGQPHQYVYGDHVYKKGALVAHNLRGYMGDEAFFNAINQFMEMFKYASVSSDSLEKWFQIYSGQNLSSFFRDWVFTPGYNVVLIDSFIATEADGHYELDLYLRQKLKGRGTYHDDIPVYYTIYDQNWQSESGQVWFSGGEQVRSIKSSVAPVYVALYEKSELAQARTTDRVVIKEPGALNLTNVHWQVEFKNVADSSLIWFDHIWSAPDFQKDWDNKPFRLSNYHYWKVSGFIDDKLEMSAKFFYDGREGGNTGYMDMDLVSVHEDSLVLLYRSNTRFDWDEYEYYEKNVLGASNDAYGSIELTKVLPGEYALANIDHSILGQEAAVKQNAPRVYSNSVSKELTIEVSTIEFPADFKFTLTNAEGSVVMQNRINQNIVRYSVDSLSLGLYHYSIVRTKGNGQWSGTVIIK